jgi:hypothetical protein
MCGHRIKYPVILDVGTGCGREWAIEWSPVALTSGKRRSMAYSPNRSSCGLNTASGLL